MRFTQNWTINVYHSTLRINRITVCRKTGNKIHNDQKTPQRDTDRRRSVSQSLTKTASLGRDVVMVKTSAGVPQERIARKSRFQRGFPALWNWPITGVSFHASWRNNCGYTPLAAVFKIQRIWDETVKTVNLTPEWLFFILYMFNKTGSINLCAFDYIRIVLSHMNVKSNFITNRIEKLGCIKILFRKLIICVLYNIV